MSGNESAFTKKLTPETTFDKVEGLLEHFNLPPKVIAFIRRNRRVLLVIIVVAAIGTVSWSLYSSYREKQIQDAASALSLALEGDKEKVGAALLDVAEKYKTTGSALWARVELGHLAMKNGDYKDASSRYQDILSGLKPESPLYGLVLFALAQSYESDKQNKDAADRYAQLKDIKGYELIGYSGMARIEESQGNIDRAIAILNDFVLTAGDDAALAQAKTVIEAKVADLKTRK